MSEGLLRILLAAALLGILGCGGEPTSKTPADTGGGDSLVDERKARKLAYDGEKALKNDQFSQARELLRQADRFATATVRDEIRVVAERIDKAEAKLLVPDVIAEAEERKCAEALDDTAEVLRMKGKGEFFPAYVRQFTKEANVACLLSMVETGDTLRHVRMLAASRTAKEALGKKAFKEFEDKLRAAVLAKVRKAIGGPLEQRKWAEVIGLLEQVISAGDAGPADVADVLAQVHKGLREEASKIIKDHVGAARGAAEALAQADKLLAVGWATKGKPTGASKKALELPPLPADLVDLRQQLSFWVVCSSVRCSASGPSKAWIYGDQPLTPTMEPKGKQLRVLKHGKAVWQIATSAGLALVADKDPGKLEGIGSRAKPAMGWLPSGGLRKDDTAEWLPPGNSIKGVRIWGLLRKSKKNFYEIGTVVAIEGGNLKVRRMADRQEVTVARGRVQYGVVKKDLRVLAMCGGGFDLKSALVLSVKETKYEAQGDPVVKLQCLDDDGKPTKEKKDEQMGSIRVDPKALPPRR